MKKKSGFSIAFYILGTIILITMCVFIVINFKNDSRIFDNLSKEEAEKLADIFLSMIKKEITDDEELEVLEDAIVFKNISNMPARVKCAVLAWHTLKEAIEG